MSDPSERGQRGGRKDGDRRPRSVLGEPLGKLGAPVGLQQPIAEAAGTRIILREAKVFREGVRFEITIVASHLEDADTWVREQFPNLRSDGRGASNGGLRFRVKFQDGGSAATGVGQGNIHAGLALVGGGVSAASDHPTARVEYRLWLAPLPPAAPFALWCAWPDRQVDETSVILDGAKLRVAAEDVVEL